MGRAVTIAGAVVAAFAFAAACGLDVVGTAALVAADGGGEAGGGDVPAGWAAVAVDPSHTGAACPPGTTAAPDAVADPDAGANACTCACAVTAPPSCATGPIAKIYGTTQCDTPGTSFGSDTYAAGTCSTQTYQGLASPMEKLTAPAPDGGACAGMGVKNPSGVAYGKSAAVCAGSAAAAPPWRACIRQAGDVACPDAWADRFVGGDGADYACASCGCSIATACGGTMAIYADTGCTMLTVKVPVDGNCHDDAGGEWQAFEYTPEPIATCEAGAPPQPSNVMLTGLTTYCCRR